VVVGVAVSVFDFGFPGMFKFSLGFLEIIRSIQRYFCYFFGLVCVEVCFRGDFCFAVEAAYIFLVYWAEWAWKVEVGSVRAVREGFELVCCWVVEF